MQRYKKKIHKMKKVKKTEKKGENLHQMREMARLIFSRNGRGLDAKTKEDLRSLAARFDISFVEQERCPDCWSDLALRIYKKISEIIDAEVSENYATDEHKWALRPEIDVVFSGIRVNSATLTDAMAERLVNMGFPLRFFKDMPKQGSDEVQD